jgi:hypothetical protein
LTTLVVRIVPLAALFAVVETGQVALASSGPRMI